LRQNISLTNRYIADYNDYKLHFFASDLAVAALNATPQQRVSIIQYLTIDALRVVKWTLPYAVLHNPP
jgi:hypothetical protein